MVGYYIQLWVMRSRLQLPRPLSVLAESSGIGLAVLYKINAGKTPTGDQAARLHHATGGTVPAWESRSDLWCEGQVPPDPRTHQSASDPEAA